MRKNFLWALIFSLVFVLSLLTSKAVASLNHQELPPALIAAIRQDFLQYRENYPSSWTDSKAHRVFFVDLNNDHVKEAILHPAGGLMCSNRSCGIFIYTKVGNNYKKISADQTDRYSAVSGSRNEPSIGVLTTSNQGWRDLATRFFDYTTRTEKWSRIRYENKGYTNSPLVVVPTPRTILEYSSGVETDLKKFLPKGNTVSNLPDGNYVYGQTGVNARRFMFRKKGNVASGFMYNFGREECFKGILEENTITKIAFASYDSYGNFRWDSGNSNFLLSEQLNWKTEARITDPENYNKTITIEKSFSNCLMILQPQGVKKQPERVNW